MSKWIMAELVRVLHNVDTDTATEIVDGLVERETPLIWEVNGKRRVLNTRLNMGQKTLVLLHGDGGPVFERDLVAWIEHSNPSIYRRDILRPMHKNRLIEYDHAAGTAEISPRGIAVVEEELLPQLP